MLLHGKALFDTGAPAFRDADLIILLEDTSLADAPATLVARTVLRNTHWSGDPHETLPFTLDIPATAKHGCRYELRAHLDRLQTGQVSRGDFITTQSHPIDLAALPAQADVILRLHWLK
ncbi:YbaY family lipoprotein [Sphaerotilus microaerophilus]|jgi:uncharacterized lipoprotein YbaY|uniref:Uncharacterized protein n=1 Tax=Sphaerotilus microaerophilus TaxID=2914710 RepID=A0ABN6PQP7_9BURK|nr:YbaY family lipoprotein [Sphaerotilus sp. FB-5]BDI05595.1 hypothetical protein CATMQ487_25650 [Sphaerotilus sp. FB-5]